MTTTMLEIPAELNGLVPAIRDMLQSVTTQLERSRTGQSVDYGAFEREAAAKLGAVERSIHGAALAALDVDATKVMINKVLHLTGPLKYPQKPA